MRIKRYRLFESEQYGEWTDVIEHIKSVCDIHECEYLDELETLDDMYDKLSKSCNGLIGYQVDTDEKTFSILIRFKPDYYKKNIDEIKKSLNWLVDNINQDTIKIPIKNENGRPTPDGFRICYLSFSKFIENKDFYYSTNSIGLAKIIFYYLPKIV